MIIEVNEGNISFDFGTLVKVNILKVLSPRRRMRGAPPSEESLCFRVYAYIRETIRPADNDILYEFKACKI